MSVTVAGKNIEMGESLKSFIVSEIEKLGQSDVGEFVEAHAVVDKENGLFCCELSIHIARGFSMRSSGQNSDPYQAVAQALSTLKQRTRRYKARLRSMERHQKDTQKVDLSRYVLADVQEEEGIQETPLIIAEIPDSLEEMSVGDAVMRLDLSELPVVVFRNASTKDMNVVYRRNDRNIGWVAPKSC